MQFEYDLNTSKTNKTKHGINFEEAQTLWDDPQRLELPTKIVNEPRHLVIGMIDGKHWSAAITYRNHNIRIISVRRARNKEVKLYESI